MVIWHNPREAAAFLGGKKTAIAIGTFDGVHRGHQAVIETLVKYAKHKGFYGAVMTFAQHPASVVNGEAPPLLISIQRRLDLLAELGVEATLLVKFDSSVASLTPCAFVREVLRPIGVGLVVIGHDFRFGAGGSGDASSLCALGNEQGFTVIQVDPVQVNGTIISSTVIRWALAAGDVHTAHTYLGRYFSIEGRVTSGEGRGRVLGFPTANLSLPPGAFWPRFGVYLVEASIQDVGRRYGVANVGARPTFGGQEPTLEVFLLDYSGDLYGKLLTVSFLHYIRPERRFDGSDSLRAQIIEDIGQAEKYIVRAATNTPADGRTSA